MSVEQLQSGSWRASVMVNRDRHRATFPTRPEAESWIATLRARATLGVLHRSMPLSRYAEIWSSTLEHRASSTQDFHRSHLRLYILPSLGHRSVGEITPSDITRFLNEVQARMTAAKAEHVLRTLSVLFRSAEADDVIPKSPVRSKKHRPSRQKRQIHPLERDEAQRLILSLQGWHRDTGLMLMATGARFGEVAGLTPHDIDLANRRINIVRRVSKGTVRSTKNHRARTLDAPQILTKTLERLVRQACEPAPIGDLQDREWDAAPFSRQWLIQTQTGRSPNLTSFSKAMKSAAAQIGITKKVHPHLLRHSFVSWMIDDGHGADRIAQWIGDTPQTVQLVYSHMLEGGSKEAADAIDRAFRELA